MFESAPVVKSSPVLQHIPLDRDQVGARNKRRYGGTATVFVTVEILGFDNGRLYPASAE
jgi:hypothetical protein